MVRELNGKPHGAAEVIWLVQTGEDKTEGKYQCSLQLPHEVKRRDRHCHCIFPV